jgi:hypothetical protein
MSETWPRVAPSPRARGEGWDEGQRLGPTLDAVPRQCVQTP